MVTWLLNDKLRPENQPNCLGVAISIKHQPLIPLPLKPLKSKRSEKKKQKFTEPGWAPRGAWPVLPGFENSRTVLPACEMTPELQTATFGEVGGSGQFEVRIIRLLRFLLNLCSSVA